MGVNMPEYCVGTAGWSYEDWESIVYPARKPSGFHPLPYLASLIDMVEINSTFYRPAPPAMVLSWLNKIAPFPHFLLAVKLHQMFTHERKGFGQKEIDEFRAALDLIQIRDRLAALLIQFPWSFRNTPENMEYLELLLGVFSGYPRALELRHASWDEPPFYAMLGRTGAALCNIDQPVFKDSIKPSDTSTSPNFAYVRLHGRNYKNWFREDAGRNDRYDYLYSKDELTEWIDRIRSLGEKSGRVYIVTNNHYRGQAMANALQIKNMLTGRKVDVPRTLLEKYPALREIVLRIESGQKDLFGGDDKTDRGGSKGKK